MLFVCKDHAVTVQVAAVPLASSSTVMWLLVNTVVDWPSCCMMTDDSAD